MTMIKTRVRGLWPIALVAVAICLVIGGVGPHLSTVRAQSTLTVPGVERDLMTTVAGVADASLPASTQAGLLAQLGRLSASLQRAESLSRQRDAQTTTLDGLLQTKVDTTATIDKIASDLQINLDQLEANVNANVNADVTATVGSVTVTVTATAQQIQADLSAQANRLLVDIKADLNVIKIITLHATAHIDAQKLSVTLHALITKLELDLNAVLHDLTVLASADVKAALAAEAQLRVDLNAQINGLRTSALADVNSRIQAQLGVIDALNGQVDSLLSSVSTGLTSIQGQI